MKRLGKQRVEGLQILKILNGQGRGKGWVSHPAVIMWRGHRGSLKQYTQTMIDEWCSRGYKNSIDLSVFADDETNAPEWLGNRAFHRAHKSNLIRKQLAAKSKLDKDYRALFKNVPPDLPYVWPINRKD